MGHIQELVFDVERYHRLLGRAGQLACPGSRLLRHYVYDEVQLGRPTEFQLAIHRAADFTGRWGKINVQGAQKGVDTMIAVDMAMMACRRMVDDVILIGSDFDIHAGFEAAKSSGARVHLVDLEAVGSRPCRELLLSADSVIAWTLEQFEGVLRPAPEKVLAAAPQSGDSHLQRIVAMFASRHPAKTLAAASAGRDGCVAPAMDAQLRKALADRLPDLTKEQLVDARGMLHAMGRVRAEALHAV